MELTLIAGFVQILLFQGLGELVSHFFLPLIPGPVIGLVFMLAFLAIRNSVPASIDTVAASLMQHLGLLFVPAAVGVVMYWPQLKTAALAIVLALVGSVVLTIAVSALMLKLLAKERSSDA
jgi:holin-like protein